MGDLSLRVYVDQRFTDLTHRLTEQREDLKDRLNAMNEFREALKDQSGRMATRDQLDELRERMSDTRMHMATLSAGVAIVVSLLGLILSRLLLP